MVSKQPTEEIALKLPGRSIFDIDIARNTIVTNQVANGFVFLSRRRCLMYYTGPLVECTLRLIDHRSSFTISSLAILLQ